MKIDAFTTVATLFSRSFATDLCALLVAYADVSASEAASRLNLTPRQGAFLYHLPFPTAQAQEVSAIMGRADLDPEHLPEVTDIVVLLVELGVVELQD